MVIDARLGDVQPDGRVGVTEKLLLAQPAPSLLRTLTVNEADTPGRVATVPDGVSETVGGAVGQGRPAYSIRTQAPEASFEIVWIVTPAGESTNDWPALSRESKFDVLGSRSIC